jgi:hypothetical protein
LCIIKCKFQFLDTLFLGSICHVYIYLLLPMILFIRNKSEIFLLIRFFFLTQLMRILKTQKK